MFENLKNIFKRSKKKELLKSSSKDTAKERLHLVLMQDRANVSADFLDLMRKEIVEVIKKYIDIDEEAMDVRLSTETNEDGTQGAPALYANIPIINIKDETRKLSTTNQDEKIPIKPPKKEEMKKEKISNQESVGDQKQENKSVKIEEKKVKKQEKKQKLTEEKQKENQSKTQIEEKKTESEEPAPDTEKTENKTNSEKEKSTNQKEEKKIEEKEKRENEE